MDPELVSTFTSITQTDQQTAIQYLSAAKNDLNAALALFFSQDTNAPTAAPTSAQQAPQRAAAPPARPAPASSQPAPSVRKTGVATFSSMRDDDEDKKNMFTGGHHSGLAVEGPPNPLDVRKQFFDLARKAGAVDFDEYQREEAQQAQGASFVGQGFRLGEDEVAPSQAVGQPLRQQQAQQPQKKQIKIVFWSNGFSVDDGEEDVVLRSMTDPANQQFLSEVQRGLVPAEFQRFGRDIDVEIEDQHSSEFVKPKRRIKVFSGQGMRLGAPTSSVPSGATPTSQPASRAPASSSSAPAAMPVTDESKPTTKLRIQLADGTKMVSVFNTTSTIGDVMNFIRASEAGQGNFVLMTTYPKKDLTDESQTLEDAGLLRGVVVQRFL